MPGPVVGHFQRLREAYDQCNWIRLKGQTRKLFDVRSKINHIRIPFSCQPVKICVLCDVHLSTVGSFIEHICGKKHSRKVGLDFFLIFFSSFFANIF